MCWQCDHPDKTIDDYLHVLRSTIRQHGWAVQYVETDRAPYAYTVGLHARGLPELLMTGLAPKRSAQLLNHAAEHAIVGGVPVPGAQFYLLDGLRVEVVAVEHPDAHMGMALAIARAPIQARQYVWADSRRRWPWARGFENGMRRQPVLGSRAA
ncbi:MULTISPECIES: DUF4262 domain-containing protein [unclassified Mycobacterium]|uniref:DUF4262 domain-containing protein n=1 Tax=unclassified Mycobacterium TaxID=2642494 RepID=UPI0029C90245|nr:MULTISPECIES: DUF4262 domain-containing protein [unclassified Mycobacterium]